jgi:hypothetical protein
VFLGGMGGRTLVVFQGRKVRVFFFFPKNISLVVWDGVEFFFSSFFLSYYDDLMKIYSQENILEKSMSFF